jgi:hypothetical protein
MSCHVRWQQQFVSGNDEDAPRIVWQASPAVNRHRAGGTPRAALDAASTAGVSGADAIVSRHVHTIQSRPLLDLT